jgi:hypothetical protein
MREILFALLTLLCAAATYIGVYVLSGNADAAIALATAVFTGLMARALMD